MINSKKLTKESEIPPAKRTSVQIKLRLIESVGEVIKTNGYSGLSEIRIARQAEVEQSLICKYFETPEKLIEEYVHNRSQSKYPYLSPQPDILKEEDNLCNLVKTSLEENYRRLIDDPELQRDLVSELAGKINPGNTLHEREETESSFFKLTDEHFKDSDLDFRSISFILESGIKFLALKSKSEGSVICGIDTASPGGKEQIVDTLKSMVDLAFKQNSKK